MSSSKNKQGSRTVLLVRHAKSDWGNPSLNDFERPLNERGKKDAPAMAERLLDRKVDIHAFISSPAKRAAKTAKFFATAYGKKKDDIIFKEDLYHADPDVIMEIICGTSSKHETIAVFTHNFGITEFANMLTTVKIDNIPTCGVFAVSANCGSWESFKDAEKEFLFFDYPKATPGD